VMTKKLYIQTYGCQMNDHDSERMAGLLEPDGYTVTDRMDDADLILMNTCSIRDKAEQKAFSELGRIRELQRQRPELIVGVAGCMARQEGAALLERHPWIRLVFGSKQIDRLPGLLRESTGSGRAVIALDDPIGIAPTLPARRKPGVRAWVSIMEGCENRCSFCVVPHSRGRERSRLSGEIVEEVRELARQGYREVTLLGQNVNSYGRTSTEGTDFAGLLSRLDGIEGLDRIRFTTSHPSAVTDRMIRAMAELPSVCEHLHLPLQSGSDRILERMNREYTRGDYRRKVEALRRAVPGLALTTDIIVGFPGETEEEFEETLEAVAEFGFTGLFAFKYSKRPHTPALELDGQLDEAVKAVRLQRLLALQQELVAERQRSLVGTIQDVLFEGTSQSMPGRLFGRTRANDQLHVEAQASLIGRLSRVAVTQRRAHRLEGVLSAA
ncbi:MAG TPA: tRNA (N6-isopentenyl adenosine(37)-C2)-methylthiotransferase MiaB, partial [Nitrospiria bacterium]|nr:tRNA (N6-isopentenyl adenosine(37)-C2)-methylthiotransferase MiaB [Nitrospiria bacterium]